MEGNWINFGVVPIHSVDVGRGVPFQQADSH